MQLEPQRFINSLDRGDSVSARLPYIITYTYKALRRGCKFTLHFRYDLLKFTLPVPLSTSLMFTLFQILYYEQEFWVLFREYYVMCECVVVFCVCWMCNFTVYSQT